MIKTYPSLASQRLSVRSKKENWANEVVIIKRVDGLRGTGRKCIFFDRKTHKQLSSVQVGKIQAEIRASLLKKEGANFEMLRKAMDEKMATQTVPTPPDDPAIILAGIPVEKIQDAGRVIRSYKDARDFLILRAMGQKIKSSGKIAFGRQRLDEKHFVLTLATSTGSLKNTWADFDVAKIIHQAVAENDIRFFKRLGRKLEKKCKRAGTDLNRCDDLACFLVDFWISSPATDPDFPPLCLFTDQAIADWCDFVLTPESDGGHFDSVRKWRQRLGLKRAKTALIKSVTKDNRGAILLA